MIIRARNILSHKSNAFLLLILFRMKMVKSVEEVSCLVDEWKTNKWTSPLILRSSLMSSKEPVSSNYIRQCLQSHDVLQYVKNQMYKNCRLYFDPICYPPPNNTLIDTTNNTVKDLIKHITLISQSSHGACLVSNSTRSGKVGTQLRIVCSHCTNSSTSKSPSNSNPKDYRQSCLHNDRKASRGKEGKSLNHRSSYQRSNCKFNLIISTDCNGYYIDCSVGCKEHSGHPHLSEDEMRFPSKLLDQSTTDDIKVTAEACASDGVNRNQVYLKKRIFLSRSQIRYKHAYHNRMISQLFPNAHNGIEKFSSFDSMMESFKERGDISYCCLYD